MSDEDLVKLYVGYGYEPFFVEGREPEKVHQQMADTLDRVLDVFLVHPGGPFWQKKDIGAWSIPKEEYLQGEDGLTAVKREFEEETGIKPEGEFLPLGDVRQLGGKLVKAWALEGDCSTTIRSNTFSMKWPPKSGQTQVFPGVDPRKLVFHP